MIRKINKSYLEKLYILFLGIISSFSLPPYNYWFICFISFSLLFIFLIKNKNNNNKLFFLYGYIFGFGYFISNLYWIPLSLLYDNNFRILIPFAIILIPGFLSLFYAFAFLTFKFLLNSKSTFVNILSFSLVLSLFEFIRGTVLSGFPWNLVAYSLSENIEFIQITSIIGIYTFNMMLITIFASPSILYLRKKKIDLLGLLFVIIIIISNYIYGNYKVKSFQNLKTEILPAEIKVLSTNIPIERFYSNIDEEKILLKLIEMSSPIQNKNTIFIWPEGIIPNINLKNLKNEYNFLFKKSFFENHKIILGVNDDQIKNDKHFFYNSLSIIDNEVNVVYKYYKNKLVPFGEFLPLENILSKIGLKSLTNNYQSYTQDTKRTLFDFGKNNKIKILPLICYEIIYSGKLSKDDSYNFIVNISEDGWFGETIGPYQHFAHSIFRSVEYGKYTLRSANNGISAIIDPSGSIINKININKEGVISIKEFASVDRTFFSTYGNKVYFLTILLYIFLIFSFKKLENE